MHRLLLPATLAAAALRTGTAAAAGPRHEIGTATGAHRIPAGALCNVPVRISYTQHFDRLVFGDSTAAIRVVEHSVFVVTHTNVRTGVSATEVDHGTAFSSATAGTTRLVGNFTFHLRDASASWC